MRSLMQDELIRVITDGLQWLVHKLEGRTVARLYDLHIVSEDFVKRFVNCLRDLDLVNLNEGGFNHPAIDLGDKKKRVSYQVTNQRTARKIQDGLDKFDKHGLAADYDEIFFLILRKKQTTYSTLKCSTIQFDPTKHIVDVPDLIRQASGSGIARLKALAKIIEDEGLMPSFPLDSDEQTVIKIHSHFDRNALKHHWQQEGPIGRFEVALNELTELLGKGTIQGNKITKPIHLLTDKGLLREFGVVRNALGALTALFNEAVNSGEIRSGDQFAFFRHRETADKINQAKMQVIEAINKIGQRYGLAPIVMYGRNFPE